MKRAVVTIAAQQYTVEPGSVISVPGRVGEKGAEVSWNDVLFVENDAVRMGNPTVSGITVTGTILAYIQDKVTARKFKRKTRYHKTKGQKRYSTRIKINEIREG